VDRVVRAAITTAVESRLGPGLTLRLERLQVNGTIPLDGIVAIPDASARAGRAAVFSLSAVPGGGGPRRRVGSAVTIARLDGPSLRAARPLSRGEIIVDADIVETGGELVGVPLRPLPGRAALVGAKMARDVSAGDVLTDIVVRPVPMVRSGDEVVLRARIDGVEARGRGIASQAGGIGAVIQVVNPETRRTLRGRVTGPGEVEVIHETR